jgi:hypothetical protein
VDTFDGILFAIVVATVVLPVLAGIAVVAIAHHLSGRLASFILAIVLSVTYVLSPLPRIGIAAIFFAAPPTRIPLVWLDLALSRFQREQVVAMAGRGELTVSPDGGFELPWWGRGLSVYGTIEVISEACGQRVFFMTVTGFSPDPYGGLEFVPIGCEPEVDPLSSGDGEATEIGDLWFWIVAS